MLGASFLALAVTGVIMLVASRPDSGATRIANKGLQASPSPSSPLQDLHESASLLILVVIVAGGGWLMVKVKQDWSGRLALVLLATAVAAITGMLIRYETVKLAGVFVEDLRGFGFLFDGDLEAVGFGKRSWGAMTYRVLVLIHLVSACAIIGTAVAGVRDVVRVQVAEPRRGNARPAS